jgi:acyl dehydratase
MLEARFSGRTYDGGTHAITAEAVRAFVEAVGDPNPAYRGGGVPPAFAAVYCLRPPVEALFRDPEVKLDLAHLVHGEQGYAFYRSPRVGEALRSRGRIQDISAKRNLDLVTFETEALDAQGAPVCRGLSLFIIRNP